MKKTLALAVLLAAAAAPALADDAGSTAADKLGWKLSVQCWTFHQNTFFEAVDNARKLGLKYVEAFPGQRLSPDLPKNVGFGPGMSDEHMALAKKKLADCGIQVVALGVIGLSKDEAQSRKVFEFCKRMGIGTINSEPAFDAFDTVEKLCKEYHIKVGLHDHPKPSRYWNPATVHKQVDHRSKLIGFCADTGHWMRSGINPVEAIAASKGRIVSMHLKDLNEFGKRGAHDVPWGTGKADIKKILTEVKKQGFHGVISIEYEYNWGKAMGEIAQCVKYFHQVAAELAAEKTR